MKFLFDLGGVFFNWDPKHFYRYIFSSEEKMDYFLTYICNDKMNSEVDAGKLIKDAEKELIQKFPKYTNEIKMYYVNHRKMIKGTFQDSIDILLELKSKGYLCFVLSNWSAETFVGMDNDYPFLRKFDGLLISGENKLVKPSIQIYDLAISRFNLNPSATVFIDDKLENIKTAKKLNFKTIFLDDPHKIKIEINKFIN